MEEGQHRPLFYIIASVLRSPRLPHSYRLNEIPHGVTLRGNEKRVQGEMQRQWNVRMYSTVQYLYLSTILPPIIMNTSTSTSRTSYI